jgi:hypothetical protein
MLGELMAKGQRVLNINITQDILDDLEVIGEYLDELGIPRAKSKGGYNKTLAIAYALRQVARQISEGNPPKNEG